ncbi:hypothetical protein [Membranihabitans marinus]|uniref:hypothetical protein n=1 Tax=Membranihabitans marinus TaxID=1227546 RepID=UPI001F3116E7|nr:hypothetical protein [Membranihabitans marinus]
MLERIYRPWNLFRIIRLIIGVVVIATGIIDHQYMLIPIGGIFTLMTILDLNNCSNNCQTIPRRNYGETENIIFEEVKSKDYDH